MSSLKDKLKGIINTPLENTSNYQNKNYNNNKRQNNKLSYTQINANNQSRSEILSQVKNKIREFKHNRENYNDDLLNFEVSREALQKYYPSHQKGEIDIKEKLNNSMNMIKTGNFNTNNNNNDMITFANPNMKFDDNKNSKSFIINNNNNYNNYTNPQNTENEFESFDKRNFTKSNSKPNIYNNDENNIFTSNYNSNNCKVNYEKKDGFLNIDIKNIFKSKNNNTLQKESKSNQKNKSSREYITFNQRKNNYSNLNNFNSNNNNYGSNFQDDKNKIKNQINLFVKELNYNNNNKHFSNYSSTNQTIDINNNNNEPIINQKRNKSYNSNSFLNNNNNTYQKNYKNIRGTPKISLLDIHSLKQNLLEMTNEDIQTLPNEYINELKDLSRIINNCFK
jgi:hypothetical protein